MRVLLVTPYSPLRTHDHAAQDLAGGLVGALGSRLELHVYAPDNPTAPSELADGMGGVVFHPGIPNWIMGGANRLDRYPRSLRDGWPHEASRAVCELQRKLAPAVVHGEYLQCAEALLQLPSEQARTLTLHDLARRVHAIEQEYGIARRLYRRWQYQRTVAVEDRVLAELDHTFVLSARDLRRIEGLARSASAIRVGATVPDRTWAATSEVRRPMVFAGAMWRSENQRIAAFLATEVLPRVRSQVGSARLRLVGALPPPEITRLESIEGVEVVGRVPSIEEEYFASGLAFCPSMVEAGILLKALIAMACGVPTVLNNNSALSFEGLVHGRQALVADDALAMASAAVSVLTSADRGASLGRSAREYVAARYTWESCAESMTTVFRNTQSGES